MNITAVIGSLARGGAERQMIELCTRLHLSGCKIRLFTFRKENEEYQLPHAIERKTLHADSVSPLVRNVRRIRALRAELERDQPDLVISFMNTSNVIAIFSSWGLGIPVIACERTNPKVHRPGWQWQLMCRLSYPFAKRIVVQTLDSARFLKTWKFPMSSAQVEVIPNFLATEEVVCGIQKESSRKIVSLGRLSHEKGFDLLLRAFGLLDSELGDWRLEIWGEGEERSRLVQLRDQLGLRDRVEFCGATAQPWEVLQSAEIYVCSSRYEGFPNALIEAMSFGKAVVSFDCPSGPSEILQPRVNGLLADSEDPQKLADCLGELMRSTELRALLGREAAKIREKLASKRVFPLWEKVMRESVGNHNTRKQLLPLCEESGV